MTDDNAEKQVDAFLHILRTRYGLSEDDLHDVITLFLRLRRRSKFAELMGEWFAKTVITVLVMAFFSGVGWAIWHMIEYIAHKGG